MLESAEGSRAIDRGGVGGVGEWRFEGSLPVVLASRARFPLFEVAESDLAGRPMRPGGE
jgi:hypothetical protein